MFLGPEGKVWKCPDCGYKIKFRKIQDIYDSKMNEIEVAKPKGIFKLFS